MISIRFLITFVAVLVTTEAVFVNDFDKPFTFNCPDTQTIGRFYSVHRNGNEDRRFDFTCQDAAPDVASLTQTCYWTDFVNHYDELVHFACPNNNYINGIGSIHDNGKEDRIFKFRCCATQGVHMVDCDFSGWTNDYDQPVDFNVGAGKVIKGIISIHDSGPEDRRFDFETCKVERLADESIVG